ncbi:MAG: hopanoid C-3 methylase HpnR [Candidatus Loosdrechtia sp.]|uniref:hopanoid C-3 methylase HpnR n=1 Tax=Candidatus Loosdrechtia sp. TaxID=3101272 RepID=UPI00403AACB5
MKFLAVHPGALMYSKIFLRLEPLGLEIVAQAVRRTGHTVRVIDLQVETHGDYFKIIDRWRPDVIAFSCNYLPNIPEIVDLAILTRKILPDSFIFAGGHSASFTAREFLLYAGGAIDCILTGEGEASIALLLEAIENDRRAIIKVPGVVTLEGMGPPPRFVNNLDDIHPARDLLRYRHKYFIGMLDPCASVEFSRGCPWDCSFCSAWTFYGRSYRIVNPEKAVEDLAMIKEKGIFIVDDVAFVQAKHGFEIGEAIIRKGIKKNYYLETRGDVLLRNKDVFQFWKRLGLKYIFMGLEAIDDEGLKKYRKRVSLDKNFESLEFARSIGITVAVNIIADTSWDRQRFEVVRRWCQEIPEIVNISVNTPYPGTETWQTESHKLRTLDFRLFDIQHAVLPTKLPLSEFYEELTKTQQIMNKKHMGWAGISSAGKTVLCNLLRGQTNFIKMLWKFNNIYRADLRIADHQQLVKYRIALPPASDRNANRNSFYIHKPGGRSERSIDDSTEKFINESRTGEQ